jgi:E3 ubiquitin-protein ligase BRE1
LDETARASLSELCNGISANLFKVLPAQQSIVNSIANAKEASLVSEAEELRGKISELEMKVTGFDRKCRKLELRQAKQPKPAGEASSERPATDENTSMAVDQTAVNTKEMKLMESELEATRRVSEARLAELKAMAEDVSSLRATVDLLNEKLRRIPLEVLDDPRGFDQVQGENKRLYLELENRKAALESLERHIGDSNSKRSHMLSKLEEELIQRRYSLKELVDSLEADCNRLRKDRDHMRELYEGANIQVASLSRQVAHWEGFAAQAKARTEVAEKELDRRQRPSGNDDEAALIAEIESIAEAFDKLQSQNEVLLKQIAEKEETISRLTKEKLKSEFAYTQAQREADLVRQKAAKTEVDAVRLADEADAKCKALRSQYDMAERTLSERNAAYESLRWKYSEYANQLIDLKARLDATSERNSEALIISRTKALEQAIFEKKRLSEEIAVLTKKLETYTSFDGAGSKDLQEQLAIYKKLMRCNSCHLRDKNVVLTKCMHVFCKECIDTRLETRQRKCPNCGESFGSNDVRQIYL